MNGPADVWFTIAMPGWSFQVPVNSEGRLIPVCQLMAVLNVWSNSTRRRPPGTVESAMSNCWRWLLMLSVTNWQTRSEEHTSELQSLAYLVCRLLLEKKKKTLFV